MFKFLFQVGTLQTFCRLITLSSTSLFPVCSFIPCLWLMKYWLYQCCMSSGAPCMYVCNKDGLKNVKKEEEEKVSSENVGLLCSRSMPQPRLKVSVNVSSGDILCIAEPFATKPSMVRHHHHFPYFSHQKNRFLSSRSRSQ